MKTKRLDILFNMGLRFNGHSYVGTTEKNKDVNFHYVEIMCDDDETWNKKIKKVTEVLKTR